MTRATFFMAALFSILCLAAHAATDEDLAAGFAQPKPEFSPVPIWWWSGDKVEPARIRDQIDKLAQGGIHNAIVLNLAPSGPLYGSAADDPPFLSDAWWNLFGVAIEEGKKAGVRLWFYDQLGFSGAGLQARVVRDHPEFRGVTLKREVKDLTGPAEVDVKCPVDGTPLAAFMARIVDSEAQVAQWIWDKSAGEEKVKRYFRRAFILDEAPAKAHINIACDNGYILYVNGERIGDELALGSEGWSKAERFEIAPKLKAGRNVIAVQAENLGGAGGLLVELSVNDSIQKGFVSDDGFRMNDQPASNWTAAEFDDSGWKKADVLGPVSIAPWFSVSGIESGAESTLGIRLGQVQNLTAQIAGNAIKVAVPEGRHRVEIFYTAPGGFDYQNPQAGAALLDVVHGEMARRFPDELGKEIAGSFQDEFPAMPRFSTRLPEEFKKRHNYDLIERLPALWDDVPDRFGDPNGPTTIQIRCAVNDVAAELCEEAFFIPLEQWHAKYGMLCGYDQVQRRADPVSGEQYYLDYFKTMRHYTAPGDDMDGDAKPHESIAELYDRPRVWLEGFHSSGWGQTPEEIATLLHPFLATGSTLLDPHAIYYSIHGSYYEWAPPDTGWRQPYFADYPVFADYVSRLCYILSKGSLVADIAILRPTSTVHAYSGFGDAAGPAKEANSAYWDAQKALRDARTDYLVIDEDSIARGQMADGRLKVGRASIKTIILPEARVVAGETLRKLKELGNVIAIGAKPEEPADRTMPGAEFKEMNAAIHYVQMPDAAGLAKFENPLIGAWIGDKITERKAQHPLPAIHRRIGNRDFYLVLSDDGTPANGQARFDINKRKLWETPAAQGEHMQLCVLGDLVPELWNALTGRIEPINAYMRGEKTTVVDLDLSKTPAPLIAFRPPTDDVPDMIQSMTKGVDILDWRKENDVIEARVISNTDAAKGSVSMSFAGPAENYMGEASLRSPTIIDLSAPFDCKLVPTCDNSDGSFAWPATPGPIPVEVRAFRFREERPDEDAALYKHADFDDSQWGTALASFGPRAEWTLIQQLTDRNQFQKIVLPVNPENFTPAVYSLRLGINEDPVFSAALGGKGRIPEEFIDIGEVKPGQVFLVRAIVTAPKGAGKLDAVLRLGGIAHKRAILNGEEVKFGADPSARTLRGDVVLQEGQNRLSILAARESKGRLRLFYHFLPRKGVPPDPEWIWSADASSAESVASGKTVFTKKFEIPGAVKSAAMVVALGDMHQIHINGKLLADQGNFDPYFTSRAERYDIARLLQTGENTIEIEARDAGHPVGLLLDGLVTEEDGTEIPFVSDASFAAGGKPARILTGPAQGYMGDPATLLLRPRPHPLPQAGWLLNQPPLPAPFDALVYSANNAAPAPVWFRFKLPPGATAMTLETPGKAVVYINGQELPSDEKGTAKRVELPKPELNRIAAIRIESIPGFEQGAALLAPITFEMGPGKIALGSWDELGLPHYAGGMIYSKEVALPEPLSAAAPEDPPRVFLDLGHVRGTVEVTVNGKSCGKRLWHPYKFDITDAAKPGVNQVEMRVFNTLGPHFAIGHPSAHVYEGQTKSGIFGPVAITIAETAQVELRKTPK